MESDQCRWPTPSYLVGCGTESNKRIIFIGKIWLGFLPQLQSTGWGNMVAEKVLFKFIFYAHYCSCSAVQLTIWTSYFYINKSFSATTRLTLYRVPSQMASVSVDPKLPTTFSRSPFWTIFVWTLDLFISRTISCHLLSVSQVVKRNQTEDAVRLSSSESLWRCVVTGGESHGVLEPWVGNKYK